MDTFPFPLLFNCPLDNGVVARKTGCPLSADSTNIFSAMLSQAPCGLFSEEYHFFSCEGIDTVQSDHAPEAGVTQVIFHGDLIRHQGGHQEELEEELEEEVERRVRRDHSSNQTQVRMHG